MCAFAQMCVWKREIVSVCTHTSHTEFKLQTAVVVWVPCRSVQSNLMLSLLHCMCLSEWVLLLLSVSQWSPEIKTVVNNVESTTAACASVKLITQNSGKRCWVYYSCLCLSEAHNAKQWQTMLSLLQLSKPRTQNSGKWQKMLSQLQLSVPQRRTERKTGGKWQTMLSLLQLSVPQRSPECKTVANNVEYYSCLCLGEAQNAKQWQTMFGDGPFTLCSWMHTINSPIFSAFFVRWIYASCRFTDSGKQETKNTLS